MIKIIADYREKSSGVPELLIQKNAEVRFASLAVGDYIINGHITVERKSSEDFIQSLINNRLFEQCVRLRKKAGRVLMLVEGNPYQTEHRIEKQAVRGALLSVMVSWQIPVMHSKNAEDSVSILIAIGMQSLKNNNFVRLISGYKPKKIKIHQLRFLQGLPCTGPILAGRLYNHFGNIKSVVTANMEELRKIKGIGKKNAKTIVDFVSGIWETADKKK